MLHSRWANELAILLLRLIFVLLFGAMCSYGGEVAGIFFEPSEKIHDSYVMAIGRFRFETIKPFMYQMGPIGLWCIAFLCAAMEPEGMLFFGMFTGMFSLLDTLYFCSTAAVIETCDMRRQSILSIFQ
jgi:hypothetical protein